MKTLDIVLCQPGYRSGPKHVNNWYLPYAIGCLWAYASHDPFIKSHVNVVDWVWSRKHINDVISPWSNVDVMFCSVYVWNEKYVSQLCEAVKQKWPNCLIVWGGPQCDHTNDKVFENKSFIDVIVVSEGEQTFKELCQCLISNKPFHAVPSTIINKGKSIIRNPLRPRSNLEDYPSPYLVGVFDDLIDNTTGVQWSATLETNRGCPYSCTFCDWGSLIASKVKKFKLDKVESELEWFHKKKINWIMIADANFGIFRERDIKIAKLLNNLHQNSKHLTGVTFSFLKNKTDVILDIAREVKFLISNGVTLSVQSLNTDTLKNIKRDNMAINDIRSLVEKFDAENIPYYTEMIIGLPGESLQSWKENYWKLYNAGFHKGITIWQLIASVNSELSLTQIKKHKMITNDVPIIDEDNHIAEYIPSVIATETMPFTDYIKAWMFSKIQNFLHSTGFSLDASVTCKQNGIEYEDFYKKLESLLQEQNSWKYLTQQMEILFEQTFSSTNQTASEKQIDTLGFTTLFQQRDVIFSCVEQTLLYYKIKEKDAILQHAKALVYDPLNPHDWPKKIDNKTYKYVGPNFQTLEQYAEIQTYRRNSIFIQIEE